MRELNREETTVIVANINAVTVLFAATSERDYEMSRVILADTGNEFTVLYGGHCSCYGFDEVEWDATEYTELELEVLAPTWAAEGSEYGALGRFLVPWLKN